MENIQQAERLEETCMRPARRSIIIPKESYTNNRTSPLIVITPSSTFSSESAVLLSHNQSSSYKSSSSSNWDQSTQSASQKTRQSSVVVEKSASESHKSNVTESSRYSKSSVSPQRININTSQSQSPSLFNPPGGTCASTDSEIYSPSTFDDSSGYLAGSPVCNDRAGAEITTLGGKIVVVAIDFGTAFSGYAFSFLRDKGRSIYVMRKWEGGDPGVINQKTLTALLLTPTGEFDSFGFTARDHYHDLAPADAKRWLFFDKFKMALHYTMDLNRDSTIVACNGRPFPALTVFAHALRYFKEHVLTELCDQSGTDVQVDDLRWVVTVPAIWNVQAKQFMRQAAYDAGIASESCPDQLLIALEPEVASIYVRQLRVFQLMPETPAAPAPLTLNRTHLLSRPLSVLGGRDSSSFASTSPRSMSSSGVDSYSTSPPRPRSVLDHRENDISSYERSHSLRQGSLSDYTHPMPSLVTVGQTVNVEGTVYMIVDCGGGTVDITVHQVDSSSGGLKECYKATGGPFGSAGIDADFERLLMNIFSADFIRSFKTKRPAGWVDLMIAFESRKRATTPYKTVPLNVSLPFSFIDYYKKHTNSSVESAIRKYNNADIRWSAQGMLRLMPAAMMSLFAGTLAGIRQAIGDVLNEPSVRGVKYMLVVGGFAESPMLQTDLRKQFGHLLQILIPQEVGLVVLKGAVLFGLDPSVVKIRRSRLTYAVGILNRFDPKIHPKSKLFQRDGSDWCIDVLDKIVAMDQPIALGDTVVRCYTPAKPDQRLILIHIYCTDRKDAMFVSDAGVKRCGTLRLDLVMADEFNSQTTQVSSSSSKAKSSSISSAGGRTWHREIQARMTFSDTEINATALDVSTGKSVKAAIDFLNR